MARFHRNPGRQSAFGVFCLALSLGFNLGLGQGCARSQPLHPVDASSASSGQKLPFHSDADHGSTSDTAHPAVSADPKLAGGVPFRKAMQSRFLPSGTLLTVQLEDSLSTAKSHAGDAFAASIAAPLTMDGETLIEPGTAVTGCVESMQSQAGRSGLSPSSGYFRLTLSAITIQGRQLALQTSSLFTRGTPQLSNVSSHRGSSDLGSDGVRVQKGRHLTFRLTSPVALDDPNSMADGQSVGPISE
jgi:hypothetical protein